MKKLDLSVHQLVDFLLRKGDIDDRVFNRSSMLEGTKIHSFYQGKQNENYISEYPLNISLVSNGVEIYLHGRADGVIKENNYYIIDEIKSTVIDLNEFYNTQKDWHLGQAKCYAFILSSNLNLSSIGIRLTYLKQGKKEKMIKEFSFFKEELEQFVYSLVDEYLNFYNIIFLHNIERKKSVESLKFPYEKYRKGQKTMCKFVYSNILNNGNLFIEAPTGIGKTMSTIFPALKALNENDEAKLFYLTAKTSGKESAFSAFNVLKKNGLKYFDVVLTAKEKICFCKDKACNPDECPFTKKYYNKISDALRYALLNFDSFSLKEIESISYNFEICPFEFQLDLSLFCDCIICDFNYAYDPISYLKRYFDDDSSKDVFLIDEAHNLVERSRNMYSSSLNSSLFKEAKKAIKAKQCPKLKTKISKILKIMETIQSNFDEEFNVVDDFDKDLLKQLNLFCDIYLSCSKEKDIFIPQKAKDLYLEVNRFLKIYELVNDNFLLYYSINKGGIKINIFCMDASNFIRKISQNVRSSIFFSATLSPIDYFIKVLGGDVQKDHFLQLESPFDKNHFLPLVADKVSIRYKDRDNTYLEVNDYIKNFISAKKGNYFVFCPSYEYLTNLKNVLNLGENVTIYFQEKNMSDKEKIDFIDRFETEPKNTAVGILVIGSFFSEGIDLYADRLIGAVVIGIGLSKINFETNQIREYFDNNKQDGYLFAYLYPAMNKVMQAVGRVIRSETDEGACLLIDNRFLYQNYRILLNSKWPNYKKVYSPLDVFKKIDIFFNKKKDLI